MSVFFSSAVHDVEELLHKDLRVVDEINWHEVNVTRLDFSLPQPTSCLSFIFVNLVLSVFGLPVNALFGFDLRRVDSLILTIWQFIKWHGSFHQKVTGHLPKSAGGGKACLSDDVDGSIVSPDILFVELNHKFQ